MSTSEIKLDIYLETTPVFVSDSARFEYFNSFLSKKNSLNIIKPIIYFQEFFSYKMK